ncbi:MAG: TonB-dependent receptor, partial [Bacteroidetes bacterium]|nr:TonB-dependent receptor [Bacteroidota bacterium]
MGRRILFCWMALCGMAVLLPLHAQAQGWGAVAGQVTDADEQAPLPGVTVVVAGTDFGTATGEDGRYDLRLPAGTHALRFSTIGFLPRVDTVVVRRDQTIRRDVRLAPTVLELDEVTVEGDATQEAGVSEIEPEQVRAIPTPFKGFQALKALPGVAGSNELSNQYSVRGGGYNENLIFINGFEVFMPFRPRQGEQEGLGLFNPELASRVTLYAGGFPARYGGKLSSALEVQYHRPEGESLSGSAYVSLLDAGATASASALDGKLGWNLGVRKARAQRFFATQELKGSYQPDYTDVQGLVGYRLAPGHEVEAVGIWADHTFDLDPSGRKTYFGLVSADPNRGADLRSVWIDYDDASRETDGYATRFLGVRLQNRLSPHLRIEHDVAAYDTEETEDYLLRGSTVIYQVDPNSDPDSDEGKIPRGSALQEETADNRVGVTTLTGRGRYRLTYRRHAAEAGWHVRQLRFDDRLDERTVVEGRATDGDLVRVVTDSLRDAATFEEQQAGAYVQNTFDALPTPDRLTVTAGLRADYFTFNEEWTVSPRLSARYRASKLLTLTGAWGIYYQQPAYRELRGTPVPGQPIADALNRDLRSQRSIQTVLGAEVFLPKRRLYLRGEAYYKALDRLISYSIENVRVNYSGENDATGRIYGLDLQVRGEFVPGLESWVNYGFMVAREDFLPSFEDDFTEGTIPRPTDQRHTLSLFVQDYIPTDPTWKLHMRALFGSGLPYTPPIPGERIGNLVLQVPGERFSARYPEYKRVDVGATKKVTLTDDGWNGPVTLELTGELLNVFDMTNTVAYTWIPNREGIWERVPTRLTPRTFN